MKTIKTITQEELERLLIQATGPFANRDRAFILLAMNTGLRVGELVGLNIADIINGSGVIKNEFLIRREIAKGKKERTVPLNDKAKAAIKLLIDFNESMGYASRPVSPLVAGRKGRLSTVHVERIVKALCISANLDISVTPHVFRHTFATSVLKKTQNLRVVQMLLGHSNISTTCVYTHPSREDLSLAVNSI